MKLVDKIENIMIALSSAWGIANIKEVMGIILLAIQIIIIIVKCVINVVHSIKLKNINEAIAELERTQKDIEEIIPKDETKEEDENATKN